MHFPEFKSSATTSTYNANIDEVRKQPVTRCGMKDSKVETHVEIECRGIKGTRYQPFKCLFIYCIKNQKKEKKRIISSYVPSYSLFLQD